MQRRVLEEDVFYHPGGDIGIDCLAGLLVFIQFVLGGNDDECADLVVRHVRAGRNYLMHLFVRKHALLLLLTETHYLLRTAHARTYTAEHTAYLLLEDDHQRHCSRTADEVEDGTCQFELEDKRYEEPHPDVRQETPEQVDRSRGSQQAERLVQQQCYQKNIYKVFESEKHKDIYDLVIYDLVIYLVILPFGHLSLSG